MSLTRSDFAAFFAAVRPGQVPFAWQERLLDDLLANASWPDRIAAPTGTGKTAVVDVHVFACALMGWGAARRLPRRLSVVVDRRVVVDSHHEHAMRVAEELAGATSGVLEAVAEGLRRLRPAPDEAVPPVITARLRGGAPPPRGWLDQPESCQVLVATPDMWGSRLLLAGYGSSPRAWPREAGLLAYDGVLVVDEAHLSQQLLLTARRVGALLTACARPLPVPGLQVVEATATPGAPDACRSVGVEPSDLDGDPTLADRLTRSKPVTLLPTAWPLPGQGPARARAVAQLVAALADLRRDAQGTVGCVLNRVATAVDVAAALRGKGLRVQLLVGRLRPADVVRLHAAYPGLLTVEGNCEVDVLVATQTVEVGVDLDLDGLVTELAPGSALAQRAGRVNRLGRREQGRIVVAVPAAGLSDRAETAPYTKKDLEASLAWLNDVAAEPDGMAPWQLRTSSPPATAARRILLQRPELADSWQWATTSEDLFAQPDRQLWLADDLEPELDVGFVVRSGLPADPAEALPLLRECRPRAYETFPVSLQTARQVLERLDAPVYLERAGEVSPLGDAPLRPGDLLLLPDDVPLLRGGVVDAEGTELASDVFDDDPRDATLRLGAASRLDPADAPDDVRPLLERILRDAGQVDVWTLQGKRELADDLDRLADLLPQQQLAQAVRGCSELLSTGRAADADLVLLDVTGEAADEPRTHLMIIDRRRVMADEDIRQTWTRAEVAVPLDAHQRAVAARTRLSAEVLGLPPEIVRALELAGLHHDDGKTDERFQRLLGAETQPLAKSGRRSLRAQREAESQADLPRRWRHEQLSALLAHEALAADPQRDLAVRLAGTTHGHGRTGFLHTSADLLPEGHEQAAAARALFDLGDWDALVEATDGLYGVWGCAYLEAVLRAADGRVSAEGS
ncbi:MAG: type I-U CRISPR-associated helicase/endonuclease Cas3 [Actinomycetota bacterium]|nr:type I-U CRISPR-associated helicase/endonuclease Cas3 [Actinomycetota bacterium]